jgi:hypothetical protein
LRTPRIVNRLNLAAMLHHTMSANDLDNKSAPRLPLAILD